jgi:hypothetical protein
MKKPVLSLVLLAAVLFINSCQKELSVETGSVPSVGMLQSDVSGDCLPKTVKGIYEAGKVLNGTDHYIEVQVNVTTTGGYTVFTDTINGVWFRAVGVFTATGLSTIKLKGNGTPVNAGVNIYVVQYSGTECSVAITTVSAGGANPAVLTLEGAPTACMVSNTAGTYVVGVPLDISNSVTIGVNVVTMGTYNISTPVSNGLIFSGMGVVAAGAQTITLNGTGIPAAAGPTNVVVIVGTSVCTFTITVTGTAPVANTDYFPLTAASWWSYDDPGAVWGGTPGDSLTRQNVASGTYIPNGQTYWEFQNRDQTKELDLSYYRKSNNDYIELTYADFYTGEFYFTDDQEKDIVFLKQNLATNQSWETEVYTGTELNLNQPLQIKYVFTCADANATATINGKSYTNVYKINWKPQVKVNNAPNWSDEAITYETWYAKGVGLIYWKFNSLKVPGVFFELNLRNYRVN